MTGFTEETATDIVLSRLEACTDPRLKEIMTSVITHLHAMVRETEPTMDEWMAAIQFLTATGQKCDDRRQEWILLSDTLGVSMLVDTINHRARNCATESTVLGPFHVADAPEKANGDALTAVEGEPCIVEGRVLDTAGNPVSGAKVDTWQSDPEGFYDVQKPGGGHDLRGVFRTDEAGRFRFRTVMPLHYPVPIDGPAGQLLEGLGRHPYRPAHIHFMIDAPGCRQLVTHLFDEDDPYLASDVVFGVKSSLIKRFDLIGDAARAEALGVPAPFRHVSHDFVLQRD